MSFILIVIVVYIVEFTVKAVADLSALQTIKNSGSVWPIAMSRAIRMLIYRQETAGGWHPCRYHADVHYCCVGK